MELEDQADWAIVTRLAHNGAHKPDDVGVGARQVDHIQLSLPVHVPGTPAEDFTQGRGQGGPALARVAGARVLHETMRYRQAAESHQRCWGVPLGTAGCSCGARTGPAVNVTHEEIPRALSRV